MENFRPSSMNNQDNSAWDRIERYTKEDRPIHQTRKIVVKGSVDVVFRRDEKPMLIVAGETAEAVASVKTTYKGDKLVIEREGISVFEGVTIREGGAIRFSGSHMIFHGPVGSVAGRDIVNGKPTGVSISQGKVVVGIALPEAPAVKIKGSGDVTLLDLRQADLRLQIEGSGDITAYGQVEHLEVDIAGSGDVDASELVADHASLSVVGSGDIEAFIRSDVRARVTGSGDILVRGNPPRREHSVAGSGKIKFK